MTAARSDAPGLSGLCSLHALAFLVLGNLAGLLMAALLVFPRAGELVAPLSYGRWAPVHLDIHLYGWGSLPLVAVLLAFFAADAHAPRAGRLAVHAWSAMVIAGCASWLLGGSSGKPFLDWRGGARDVLVAGMAVLFVALAVAFASQARRRDMITLARGGLLLGLLPVPLVMAWAARPDVYPAINPESGGPTGVSLMGSVLGMVALLGVTPLMLGLVPGRRNLGRALLGVLAVHGAAFLALDKGNHSHHEPLQIAALCSMVIWIPLLALWLREFSWPPGSAAWLPASLLWAIALTLSGIVTFLPGMLEHWKFTHALVAHAHVALAGLVTSWNMLLLVVLTRGTRLGAVLSGSRSAWAWNATLCVHLAALLGLGALEQVSPGDLLPAGGAADALLVLRMLSGAGMLAVSCWWLLAAWKENVAP